jgi:hypothetical protein
MISHVHDNELEQRFEETMNLYRVHGVPFKWSIGPMSSPNFEPLIQKQAESSWGFRGMAIDCNSRLSAPDLNCEIVHESNFNDFIKVNIEGWGRFNFSEQAIKVLTVMTHHPKCRVFIIRHSGKPVASAVTILKNGYGYLADAVVLESFRGNGAYRTLVKTRLDDLRKLGISFAVTQARESTSAPILEKFGFESVFSAKMYAFDSLLK